MRLLRWLVPVAAAGLAWHFFYAQPVPWPDEATFADPAVTLLQHGTLGTPSMAVFMPSIAAHTYWMWPLYFLVMAGTFKVFGASLVVMRVSTLVTGAAVWLVSSRLAIDVAGRRVAWMSTALLAAFMIDARFLRATLVGRMDMLATLLILVTIALAARCGRGRALGAGTAAGLAAVTHPLGAPAVLALIVMLWRDRRSRERVEWVFAAAGVLVPLALWAAYVSRDPQGFLDQFRLQLAFKSIVEHRWYVLMTIVGGTLPTRTAEGLWLIAGFIGLMTAPRSLVRDGMLGALIALVPLVATSAGMWYLVYVLPFAAIGMASLALRTPKTAAMVALLFAASNGATLVAHSRVARTQDYPALVRAVRSCVIDHLPDGAVVLFDSIPDVHIGVIDQSNRLQLRQSSSLPLDPSVLQRARREADVVIVADRTTDRWQPGGADTAGWDHLQISTGGFPVEAWWPRGRVPLTPGACPQ